MFSVPHSLRFLPALILTFLCFAVRAESEQRTVAVFRAVAFSGAGIVEIVAGKPQAVRLETEEGDLGDITTDVSEGTLHITREKPWWKFGFGNSEPYTVRIALPHLESVMLAGAAQVHVGNLDGGDITFALAGANELVADGHVDSVTLSVVGAGQAHFPDLAVDTAVVSVVGAGDVLIKPTKTLTVSIIGAGDVAYAGAPQIAKTIIGGGELRKLD